MKYLTLFSILTLLGACTNKTLENHVQLMDRFMEYRNSQNTHNNNPHLENQYFTPQILKALNESRANDKNSDFLSAINKFPNELVKITSHSESIIENTGCLMINGTNSEHTPTDYYIVYKRVDARWLIDNISVKFFLDGTERFLDRAVCDDEEQEKIWIKHMENKFGK